jgi:hypothetical protein
MYILANVDMREGGECANKMIVLWPDAAWNTGQLWPEQAGISVNLSIPPPPPLPGEGDRRGGGEGSDILKSFLK